VYQLLVWTYINLCKLKYQVLYCNALNRVCIARLSLGHARSQPADSQPADLKPHKEETLSKYITLISSVKG